MQRQAVDAAIVLRIRRRFQELRRLRPAAGVGTGRERLRLYDVVSLSAGAGPSVPAELTGNPTVGVRLVPELRHQAIYVCGALARVERTGVRFAGELESDGGELLVHDLEEHVAVEVLDRAVVVGAKFLFRVLVLCGGHL